MKTKKILGLILLISLVAIGAQRVGSWLPYIGNLDTPSNSHISKYYITNSQKDTGSPNIVTAVLADYRSFDTLFETCVLYLSGIVVISSLQRNKKKKQNTELIIKEKETKAIFGGIVLDAAFRMIVPVIMIYGVYVLFHGEVSLGGGFQAGALLACAYILDRIIPSFNNNLGIITSEGAIILAGIGGCLYLFTGLMTIAGGGRFLEYDFLPIPFSHCHSAGIFMIECGVTVCVFAVLINILEMVLERTEFDD